MQPATCRAVLTRLLTAVLPGPALVGRRGAPAVARLLPVAGFPSGPAFGDELGVAGLVAVFVGVQGTRGPARCSAGGWASSGTSRGWRRRGHRGPRRGRGRRPRRVRRAARSLRTATSNVWSRVWSRFAPICASSRWRSGPGIRAVAAFGAGSVLPGVVSGAGFHGFNFVSGAKTFCRFRRRVWRCANWIRSALARPECRSGCSRWRSLSSRHSSRSLAVCFSRPALRRSLRGRCGGRGLFSRATSTASFSGTPAAFRAATSAVNAARACWRRTRLSMTTPPVRRS